MKERIYIDTSVIGGCFDEEFKEWSNILIKEFVIWEKIPGFAELYKLGVKLTQL